MNRISVKSSNSIVIFPQIINLRLFRGPFPAFVRPKFVFIFLKIFYGRLRVFLRHGVFPRVFFAFATAIRHPRVYIMLPLDRYTYTSPVVFCFKRVNIDLETMHAGTRPPVVVFGNKEALPRIADPSLAFQGVGLSVFYIFTSQKLHRCTHVLFLLSALVK